MSAESEKKLEAMLAAFEKNHATEGKNLRELIGNTPELKQLLVQAIDKGNLTSINPLDATSRSQGTLGSYDPANKGIQLPMDFLAISDKDPLAANKLRMTVGHEIQHAINRDSIQAYQDKAEKSLLGVANGPSPHDYTATLKTYNADARDREARDEISGFNVMAAHVKRENPNATQQQLYRKMYDAQPGEMQSYFDVKGTAPNQTYAPKPGITINDKLQVEPTAQNVEAFGKYFYDARGYPANYLGNLINGIGQMEQQANQGNPKPPEVRVNLGELGLTTPQPGQAPRNTDVTLPSNVVNSTAPRLEPNTPEQQAPAPTPGTGTGHSQGSNAPVNAEPPRPRPDAPEMAPPSQPSNTGHDHNRTAGSTGDKQLDELINSLKDPNRLNGALQNLRDSNDGQQFRQDGRNQFEHIETVKLQEAARLQPITQEPPAQETPARKMGSM